MSNLLPRREREHIGAYIDATQRQRLVELARQEDRSVSAILRRALHAELERSVPALKEDEDE